MIEGVCGDTEMSELLFQLMATAYKAAINDFPSHSVYKSTHIPVTDHSKVPT